MGTRGCKVESIRKECAADVEGNGREEDSGNGNEQSAVLSREFIRIWTGDVAGGGEVGSENGREESAGRSRE